MHRHQRAAWHHVNARTRTVVIAVQMTVLLWCLSTFYQVWNVGRNLDMPDIQFLNLESDDRWNSSSSRPACKGVPSFEQVWNGLAPDNGQMQAAIFTPYDITPGGGEKYMLSIVLALQQSGYMVTIYTYYGNWCNSKRRLMDTATSLEVDLQESRVDLQIWGTNVPHVRIFFALGNEKYPHVRNIGLVGFFMCQFPFDLDQPMPQEKMEALQSYEYVLLNSRYSFNWYNKFLTPTILHLQDSYQLLPSIEILHPPCSIHQYYPSAQRQHIVMLGRFFQGRQSKGHVHAIKMFSMIKSRIPASIRLVLLGQLVNGHDAYLESLRALVDELGLSSRVDFIISQPSDVIKAYLGTAIVQWHLTGIDAHMETDPASFEHFGISIVEGMSAGCIPIALKAGPADIISHGVDGFLATSIDDVMAYTEDVLSGTADHINKIRTAAVAKSAQFSYDNFQKHFNFFVIRGLTTRSFRHFISTTMRTMLTCTSFDVPRYSPMTAMIVEPRNHYALEYVIYNAMGILARSSYRWSLHLFYTSVNAPMVKRIASVHSLRNIQLHEMPTSILGVLHYNWLMKTEEVWATLGSAMKVLVFQTDSLLLRQGIEKFLECDYVGAPWHRQNERWDSIVKDIPTAVGNGGFSLRTVPLMRNISRLYGGVSPYHEHEDIFFAKHTWKTAAVCSRPAAYEFCLEVPCDELKIRTNGPFAVHAAWYYNPLNVVQELLYDSVNEAVYGSVQL